MVSMRSYMSFTDEKRNEIKLYLLRKIDEDDILMQSKVADAFGISLTSVKRYINAELEDAHIIANDKCKCGYKLVSKTIRTKYSISEICEHEDMIVYTDILPKLTVNENAKKIWQYSLTEIFNNSIEHSDGKSVTVYGEINSLYTRISIVDDGIGIYKNVTESMKKYGLPDPRLEDAVTELYKGKFSSKPENHSGEGIFFSMRLLEKMSIVSDGIVLRCGFAEDPEIIKSHILAYAMKISKKGTVVTMQLENNTSHNPLKIFNEYSNPDDGFYRTKIPVFEACLDRNPIARSQARRICSRLENFHEAILDFENAEIMGQGFADEVFRVFKNKHPETTLTPINMNAEVQMMYLHALNTKVTVPHFDY